LGPIPRPRLVILSVPMLSFDVPSAQNHPHAKYYAVTDAAAAAVSL
jgi:hypothetical protein